MNFGSKKSMFCLCYNVQSIVIEHIKIKFNSSDDEYLKRQRDEFSAFSQVHTHTHTHTQTHTHTHTRNKKNGYEKWRVF